MVPQRATGTVLGLVGQVCSGKSTVARLLEQAGAQLLDADEVVRALYQTDQVRTEVAELFGPGVLAPDGNVDRQAIARRVFQQPALLRQLTERILWPRTGRRIGQCIDQFRRRSGRRDLLVLDAPTLFEAGRAGWCDRILLVTAPLERRLRWAQQRGWSPVELQRREAALMPLEQKRDRADVILHNDMPLQELRSRVERLRRQLAG